MQLDSFGFYVKLVLYLFCDLFRLCNNFLSIVKVIFLSSKSFNSERSFLLLLLFFLKKVVFCFPLEFQL